MTALRYFLPLFFVFGLTQSAFAQHAELDGLEVRESGAAYLKAIRLRGIDRDVAYFDPTRPPPPFETDQTAQSETTASNESATSREIAGGNIVFILIASAVLLLIAYLFIIFGGRLPVSFARSPEDGGASGRGPSQTAGIDSQTPLSIDAVLRIKDRRQALVALCKSLLARVMATEGVLLQDSWTDRDTLRRVPRGLPERDALQALVYASERVQFGGRDVSEDEFDDHVARLKPFWIGKPT